MFIYVYLCLTVCLYDLTKICMSVCMYVCTYLWTSITQVYLIFPLNRVFNTMAEKHFTHNCMYVRLLAVLFSTHF